MQRIKLCAGLSYALTKLFEGRGARFCGHYDGWIDDVLTFSHLGKRRHGVLIESASIIRCLHRF